jgi:hypothetical protein
MTREERQKMREELREHFRRHRRGFGPPPPREPQGPEAEV